jgi:succinylglutamate desuccinylase
MDNFLALTLGRHWKTQGTTHGFDWQWIGHGMLELTPLAPLSIRWCCLRAFMAMKPRR